MTGYLLDTNVISELRKPRPATAVLAFFKAIPAEQLFICDVTMAEIRFGAELRTLELETKVIVDWLENEVRPWFAGRLLQTNEEVWRIWKSLEYEGRRARYTYPQPDLVIAAIAVRHGLTVVTRDMEPFVRAGVRVISPWTEGSR